MYCAQLSGMTSLTDIQREAFDKFFALFLDNGYITLSKAVYHTGMNSKLILNTFEELCQKDFLQKIYAVKCPECGHLIKRITDIDEFDCKSVDYCYSCEMDIEITESDVIVLYARKGNTPFGDGQHSEDLYETLNANVDVAPMDSLFYQKSISASMVDLVTTFKHKVNSEDQEKAENQAIMKRVDNIISKNKRWCFWIIVVFRFIIVVLLLMILWKLNLERDAQAFITVIMYVLTGIIEPAIRKLFPTDYEELRRKEITRRAI